MVNLVTIDGPAASGKSSVSRELARRLGWSWISTGAFYRGLAFVAHKEGIPLSDENALFELISSNVWAVEMKSERTEVYYRSELVTDEISQDDVGQWASRVSGLPKVREGLLKSQRDCEFKAKGLVAEGRDCGSVVFPNAPIKVYLTADQVQRAVRRANDLGASVEDTVASQEKRDHQDSTRKVAPLLIPENAWILDTTDLSLDEAVGIIERYVRDHLTSHFNTSKS